VGTTETKGIRQDETDKPKASYKGLSPYNHCVPPAQKGPLTQKGPLVVCLRPVRTAGKACCLRQPVACCGPVRRAVRTVNGRTPRTPGARPGPSTGPVRRSGPGLVASRRDRSDTTQARTIHPEPEDKPRWKARTYVPTCASALGRLPYKRSF
jgi:hypothetical protein